MCLKLFPNSRFDCWQLLTSASFITKMTRLPVKHLVRCYLCVHLFSVNPSSVIWDRHSLPAAHSAAGSCWPTPGVKHPILTSLHRLPVRWGFYPWRFRRCGSQQHLWSLNSLWAELQPGAPVRESEESELQVYLLQPASVFCSLSSSSEILCRCTRSVRLVPPLQTVLNEIGFLCMKICSDGLIPSTLRKVTSVLSLPEDIVFPQFFAYAKISEQQVIMWPRLRSDGPVVFIFLTRLMKNSSWRKKWNCL